MEIFKKNSILNPSFEWFKDMLADDFNIEIESKPKIIFGYNGIGKSTLFYCMKDFYKNNITFASSPYDNFEKVEETTINIAPNITKIDILSKQIFVEKTKLNIKTNLKNSGITKVSTSKIYGKVIEDAYSKSEKFNGFNNDINIIQDIEKRLNNQPFKIFIVCKQEFDSIKSSLDEIGKERERILNDALLSVDQLVDNSTNKCPICDSIVENFKSVISSKIKNYKNAKTNLILKLKENQVSTEKDNIDNLISIYNDISKNAGLFSDLLLCSASSTLYNQMNRSFILISNYEAELNKLEEERKNYYKNILKIKDSLILDLIRFFKISKKDIIFKDACSSISINLPRKINTYSTGEINLMYFLLNIYNFIGSDNNVLILDDPVSSLDMINQYKIAFEIVKNVEVFKKQIIIFTHYIDLINIIYSQKKDTFEYYYLDRINEKIYIEKIDHQGKDNVITLDNLKEDSKFNLFIKTLKEKSISKQNNDIHKSFHYTKNPYFHKFNNVANSWSNHDLITLIDNFSGFTKKNYQQNAFEKVLIVSALRVWIEKQLYELIDDKKIQEQFLIKETLGEKIDLILPRLKKPLINIQNPNLRDFLMSRKVLLNQSIHIYSQILPLSYSLNLSCDDISFEIDELKKEFKRHA